MGDHKSVISRPPAQFTDLHLQVIQELCRNDAIMADFVERVSQGSPVNPARTAMMGSIAVTAAQILNERAKLREQVAQREAEVRKAADLAAQKKADDMPQRIAAKDIPPLDAEPAKPNGEPAKA